MKKDRDASGGPSPGAISDPRFARVHTDPRFMRMPKSRTKVSIDKRFAHMFSDKNFSDPLGADKRGRAKKKKERHMLQRYYKVGEGEEGGEAGDGEGADGETGAKGKKLGQKVKSRQSARPAFPGPVAPSKLGLEESDDEDDGSDEEIEVKPKLKGKKLGEKGKSKDLARGKSSKPAVEESEEEEEEEEEESDEEDDSDEEMPQKSKLKDASKQPAKAKGKQLPRPKHSAPVLEESDEEDDSDEEIDLNSDEELEHDAGRNRNALIAQQDGDSSEDDDDDASEDDESSSSSSSSSESEPEEEMDDAREEEQVPTAPGAETRRFAMMNMDWEHIKAVDLLMLMRSFQPKGGRVESVTVYPSEFGIEQMKKEEVHGPSIFEDEDDDDEEDKEVNMEKLRAYEKNKLKYYYAVVECDSKETANHLYTQCDGMEFERTSNTLDLRFIPDDMTFAREPRDVVREVPDSYTAPEFETRALQHSTVKLTWDDDEPTRVKALRKKFNADELNEMDFRAYLASESSEEELEEEEEEDEEGSPSSLERGDASNGEGAKSKKDKYRSLLLGDSAEMELPGQKKKKGDVDMEVTFHTGLSELSEKLMQKKEAKQRGDETVWEAYLRKKKEKKAQKKRRKNAKGSDDDYSSEEDVASPREGDPFVTHEDTGFDDPFFADAGEFPDESKAATKKSDGKEKQSRDSERLKKREEKEQQKKEEERSKAELELLLMDDEGVQGAARGFNLKSKKDKKKDKGKKKKKGGKDVDEDDQEEDKLATADLTDPRFAPLFTNHHYAIDPTNPQFRKSAAQLKILAESQRRRVQKSEDGGDSRTAIVASDGANEGSQDRKRKAELSSLVRSLKRKAGKK